MPTTLYIVGGAVRDHIMGRESSDIDFVIEGPANFEDFIAEVSKLGKVLVEFPQLLTCKAHVELDTPLGKVSGACDFAMPREEASYTDARHPDSVKLASSIVSDLYRRDFTMNAMALTMRGVLIDVFGGKQDIKGGLLRCVKPAKQSLTEDPTRAFRALRFMAQFNLVPDEELWKALDDTRVLNAVQQLPVGRKHSELEKWAKRLTPTQLLKQVGVMAPPALLEAIFDNPNDELWFKPQLNKR